MATKTHLGDMTVEEAAEFFQDVIHGSHFVLVLPGKPGDEEDVVHGLQRIHHFGPQVLVQNGTGWPALFPARFVRSDPYHQDIPGLFAILEKEDMPRMGKVESARAEHDRRLPLGGRDLHRLGFQLYATTGTAAALARIGLPVTKVGVGLGVGVGGGGTM